MSIKSNREYVNWFGIPSAFIYRERLVLVLGLVYIYREWLLF